MKNLILSRYQSIARKAVAGTAFCLLAVTMPSHAMPEEKSSAASQSDTLSLEAMFTAMPDSIIPYLSRNNRLDMVDFMKSKMKAQVDNGFGQKSTMTNFTDDYLRIELHEGCDLEMRRFSYVGDRHQQEAVCVVFTFKEGTQALSSRVKFYDASWKELTPKAAMPGVGQLWSTDSLTANETAEMKLMESSMLVASKLSPEEPVLESTPMLVAASNDERKLFDRCRMKKRVYLRSLFEWK